MIKHHFGQMRREFVPKSSLKSIHNWILLIGAAFGLGAYLPTWLRLTASVMISGIPHIVLSFLLITLAVRRLKQHRSSSIEVEIEDQWLGSSLVLGGLAIFYFYYPAVTPQALGCMIIFIGGVLSYQGLTFLRQQRIAIALLVLSLHPNLERIARHLWSLLMSPTALSKLMAWASSWALRAIGQSASFQEQSIVLPAGNVEVAPGCDGFEMTFVITIAAILIGLAFRVRSRLMIQLIAIGITLALTLNILRISVMVLAAVYWGKAAFEFWHGTIGGQIFSGVLFTLYYFAIQPTLEDSRER